MKIDVFAILIAAPLATLMACSSPPGNTLVFVQGEPGSGGAGGSGSGPANGMQDGGASTLPDGAPAPSSEAGSPTGVPCDVATLLASQCTSCHSDPPVAESLAGLVTYADLTATSHEDTTKNEAELSVVRMQSTTSPMPPGSTPSAADVAILQNWITAGYPKGSCASDAGSPTADSGHPHADAAPPPPSDSGPPPADSGPPVDSGSSNVFAGLPAYVSTSGGSGHHNPGQDCMSSCHNHGFTFAGTLYDGSGNPVSSAEVRLVDAKGTGISVYTATNGNFYSSTSWTGPGTVGARNGSSTVQMVETVSTGVGCNSCHSTSGTTTEIHLP